MRPAKSFTSILALGGRVVIFTPSAAIALPFEQLAERRSARVVYTRGFEDAMVPLSAWHRLCVQREHGVLSCDQRRFVSGVPFTGTDVVWVGDMGDPLHVAHLRSRFNSAMNSCGSDARHWVLPEDAV